MSHLLFDFFGTLVDYSPSRTTQGFRRSHTLAPGPGYRDFLAALDATFAAFDRRSDIDDTEFSMREVATALLDSLGCSTDPALFERTYIAEWQSAVTPLPGVDVLLKRLREQHRLAVVSNTHSPTMVPELLATMGVADLFDAVVLSVDVGRRKPHPAVYAAALGALGITAADGVFVGDSYAADYAGPTAVGIPAFLIDPRRRAPVPASRRIDSVFDLPAVLR